MITALLIAQTLIILGCSIICFFDKLYTESKRLFIMFLVLVIICELLWFNIIPLPDMLK